MCKFWNNQRGMTLTEVMIAVLIASIAAIGLALVFIFGLRTFQQANAKIVMYNDVMIALGDIAKKVRYAHKTELPSFGGSRLVCRGVRNSGDSQLSRMEIDWDRGSQSLWFRSGYFVNENEKRLIPSSSYSNNQANDKSRVRVTYCRFSNATGFQSGDMFSEVSPNSERSKDYVAITVEMKLENGYGDVLQVKRTIQMNNSRAGLTY